MALKKNVGNLERAASVLVGGLALAESFRGQKGITLRSLTGSTGAALLWRGLSGNCPLYSNMGINTSSPKLIKPQSTIERSAAINKPVDEVQLFLEQGETPFGTFIPTGAGNYEIELGGKLWMLDVQEHSDGRRTLIKMSWDDHMEAHGGLESSEDGERENAPKILELRKLKALIETGEIPTIEGQSHGERSRFGTLVENFGNFLIEKVQSRTPLDDEPLLNQESFTPEHRRNLKEAIA